MRKFQKVSLALLLAVLMLLQSVAVFADVSPIVYEVNEDGSITSYVYARNLSKGARLYTAVYNEDGSFAFATKSGLADKAGYLKTTVTKEDGQNVKSFVWDKENSPFYMEGEYSDSISASDVTITLNGNDLLSYLAEGTELAFGETYEVDIKSAGFNSVPVVRATSKDSQVKCSVEYANDNSYATISFMGGDRILSDETATYTNASGGSFVAERYTNSIVETITVRFNKSWLGEEDLISGSPCGAIITANTVSNHYKKEYTLADGENVKKISLKIASVPYQGAFIVLRPTGTAEDKNVLVNSDGSAISWVDDNNVWTGASIKSFDYDTYTVTEYGKTSKTAVTSNTTVAAMKELSYGDNKKQTGGRMLTDRTPIFAMSVYGVNGSKTTDAAKAYEGCNYISFASVAVTDATLEFHVDKDVEVNVFGTAALTISDVDGDTATAWAASCKGSDYINRRYQNSVDVVSVAWLIKEGVVRTEDIQYRANQNVKYDADGDGVLESNESLKTLYEAGTLPDVITGKNKSAYYIARYDAIDYLVAESGSNSGWGFDDAKGLKDIPNSILPYYYSETYKVEDILEMWDDIEYSVDKKPLVTDFTATSSINVVDMPMEVISGEHKGEKANYTGTITVAEGFRPKIVDFFGESISPDRNGLKLNADGTLNNANGTGALVSYPDGFGLEDATFICYQNGWNNDDGFWFGKDTSSWYINKKGNQVDLWNNKGTAYPWASFKVTRDAEVLIFATSNVPYLDDADSGYTKTTIASSDDYLKGMRILPANTYNFYIVYSRKYNAGDVVELKTPRASGILYCAFVKESDDAVADATLSSITINGTELAGFDPEVTEYTYALSEEEALSITAPVVEAVANDTDCVIRVIKPNTFPGSVKIIVNHPAGGTKIYTINYTENYDYITNVSFSVEGKIPQYYKGGLVIGDTSWLATDRQYTNAWHITAINDPALVGNDKIIGAVDGYVSGTKLNFTLKRPARIRVLLNNSNTTWNAALQSEGFVEDSDKTTIRVVASAGANVRNYMRVFTGEFSAQDMSITFAKPDMPALYAIEYLPFQ